MTPGLLDHLYLLIVAAGLPIYAALTYPRMQARVQANEPGALLSEYRETMVVQWSLAAALFVFWALLARPVALLGFSVETSSPFWIGLAGVSAILGFFIWQLQRVRVSPKARVQVRHEVEKSNLQEMLPTTAQEMRGMLALSLTAGFCEELVYRGFMIWYLQAYTGVTLSVVFSSLLFGLAHFYQGREGIVKTALGGLVFGTIYVYTGSIWLSILLHAGMDAIQTYMIYVAQREQAAQVGIK